MKIRVGVGWYGFMGSNEYDKEFCWHTQLEYLETTQFGTLTGTYSKRGAYANNFVRAAMKIERDTYNGLITSAEYHEGLILIPWVEYGGDTQNYAKLAWYGKAALWGGTNVRINNNPTYH